jgi:hypothetical protein
MYLYKIVAYSDGKVLVKTRKLLLLRWVLNKKC